MCIKIQKGDKSSLAVKRNKIKLEQKRDKSFLAVDRNKMIGLKFVTYRVTNFFFRRMIFKTIKNTQNNNFQQKQHFLMKKKNLKFDPSKFVF